jgi:hypothetical protein
MLTYAHCSNAITYNGLGETVPSIVVHGNSGQATFPTMLVAGLAKATPAELWEITDDTERAVPAVDLSSTKPMP